MRLSAEPKGTLVVTIRWVMRFGYFVALDFGRGYMYIARKDKKNGDEED